MNKRILWTIVFLTLTLIGIVLLTAVGRAGYSNQTDDSLGVILIPIEFKGDRWFLGERGVQILPCNAPGPSIIGEAGGPLIRIVGEGSKEIYSESLPMDPRIIIYEGPSEGPSFLEEGSVVLKIPLLKNMQTLEFFLNPEAEEGGWIESPDLRVDLEKAIAQYIEAGGRDQPAECQEPEYKPDALK